MTGIAKLSDTPLPPPLGYIKLPPGSRCRCVHMWSVGEDFYCCNKRPPSEAATAKPAQYTDLIEDVRGLPAGVTVTEECLFSIAVSLKRIADAKEQGR